MALFGGVRPAVGWSAAWPGVLAFLAGGRAIAGSTFGLDAAPDRRLAVMSIRAACLQYAYLAVAGLGGAALALEASSSAAVSPGGGAEGYRGLGLGPLRPVRTPRRPAPDP